MNVNAPLQPCPVIRNVFEIKIERDCSVAEYNVYENELGSLFETFWDKFLLNIAIVTKITIEHRPVQRFYSYNSIVNY